LYLSLARLAIFSRIVLVGTIFFGIVCGLLIGGVDVAIMIPMNFESKRKRIEAMAGAFVERFMLGFLIPNTTLGIHPVITGLILGIGLSIPTAIITRVYLPIVGMGVVAGTLVGFASSLLL